MKERIRKEKGITQKELGEKLNITDKAISEAIEKYKNQV